MNLAILPLSSLQLCGAVQVRASSLRSGAVAGQTFRPAQGFSPDVDDDITHKLSQTIAQHNGELLLKVLFCEDIAGVLSDVALTGIGIFWDFLINCWRIGNVRCDDMMGVMTLFEDDQGGYDPPW